MYNKIYNEVYRTITFGKETKINNFIVFSRTKFQKNKGPTTIKVAYEKTLTLQKNSYNLVEVKNQLIIFQIKIKTNFI